MSAREESVLTETPREDLLDAADNVFTLAIADGGRFRLIEDVRITNPYDLDLDQYIPNRPIKYEDFVLLAAEVISKAQERAEINSSERVSLVKEFNPEQFSDGEEAITIKLLSRKPASNAPDGVSRKAFSFRTYDQFMDPNYPNKVIEINQRPIEHEVQFGVWAKTATLADARALWLERLFIQETWVFKSKGASIFLWEGRTTDTLWQHSGARLHQRNLNFKVRLHEYTVTSHPTIRQINFKFSNIDSD